MIIVFILVYSLDNKGEASELARMPSFSMIAPSYMGQNSRLEDSSDCLEYLLQLCGYNSKCTIYFDLKSPVIN